MHVRLLYPTILILLGSPAFVAGQVTVVDVARVVSAGPNVKASQAPGIFDDAAQFSQSAGGCAPFGCVTTTLTASASQRSMITTAPDGALEVRTISTARQGFTSASSRLASTFVVDGAVPFFLRASGEYGTIRLAGPNGPIVDRVMVAGEVVESGQLAAGTYTLAIETAASGQSHLDVQFTAGPALDPLRPRCFLGLTRQQYAVGHTVQANFFQIMNPSTSGRAVEVKLWLRGADGRYAPLVTWGADGGMLLPPGFVGT